MKKNNMAVNRVAISLAVWSALVMLLIWSLANMGIYVSAAQAMMQWHTYFSLSFMGLIGGMVEAAVISYLGVYSFVFVYNLVNIK